MKSRSISMVELRNDAEKIIGAVRRGQRVVLTYRGKPVLRLEPIEDQKPEVDDPFYTLGDDATIKGASLTNQQIDEIVYGR